MFLAIGPWLGNREHRGDGGRILASYLTGGGGPEGEKLEERKGYLGVTSVGVGVSCSGGSMCAGGRRWSKSRWRHVGEVGREGLGLRASVGLYGGVIAIN